MFDTEDVMRSFRPDWTRATGNQVALAFACASPAEVDEIYARVVAAGFHGEKEPWDAFWGQRYAQLQRPDGVAGRPLRGALNLVEIDVELVDGLSLSILRPPDADALIDEVDVRRGGVPPVLGRALAERRLRSRATSRRSNSPAERVLELGCGLGLPSLAAALRGADVLATDWAEDAIELLRRNAERNAAQLRVERVIWSEPELLLRDTPWDLVLGADLLYEERNAEQLAALLPRLGGEVLLAEPGRPYAKEFLERFRAEQVAERIYRLAC